MFCDELKIKVIAGKGGNGCVSFRREKFVPRGGPDGGDGGNGGSIIIKTNPNFNTLSHLSNKKTYKAQDGISGKGKKMHGKNGLPLTIEVPTGTIIFNEDKSKIIADLSSDTKQIEIVKGGKGGLGNARFASSTHQAPRFAEDGEPGEELDILLELKLVADVGLIGFPSVGKSTLISVISNARPKIAAYDFTTLIPNLGVVHIPKSNNSFVVADIPGLIENASEGKGLGHQFLKHIARTKLLVHILDLSKDELAKKYKIIRKELKKFDPTLAKREEIVVLNKIDLFSQEEIKEKTKKLPIKKIFQISAVTHEGLQPLLFEIVKKLEKIKKKEIKSPAKKPIPILKPHLYTVKFTIEKIIRKKDHKIFKIKGSRIEQLIIMTDIKNSEGLERIYQYLDKTGINLAIKRKEAKIGDIIKIKEKQIPYRP
ncbi:MAG: GTPase ObgE [Candidatus Peregrinibacteria bacterium]